MDPLGVVSTFQKVQESWVERSEEFQELWISLLDALQSAVLEEMNRILQTKEGVESIDTRDSVINTVKNYASFARRLHTILGNWLRDLIEKAKDLNEHDRMRAYFWARQIMSALNPSNYFWTNPFAVQKFIDSGGKSFLIGMGNWFEDLFEGEFLSRLVDNKAFEVGRNIATTPGKVIYRNRLMELIQYACSTEKVYEYPIVFIPPWINKYYILDLTPETSMVRYLRDQGFTVFTISWRNPNETMKDVTFDDYMIEGALRAIQISHEVCRTKRVHAVGYCIGGTALAALMAWLNRERRKSGTGAVATWTLFSTLVDFSEPGEIGVFINKNSVEFLESILRSTGYLDKRYIDLTFRLLGADNLIWRNVIHNYLYGGTPPRSEMLYWNTDGTNLPAAMCSFYLKEFYMNNRLVEKNGVTLAGYPIDLGLISQPLYCVGTHLDHICPWKGTFKTVNHVSCDVRYVLSSEGHISGIINPPSAFSRRRYWAGKASRGETPDEWLARQEVCQGSWWPDWVSWLTKGDRRSTKARLVGNEKYPPLEEAPGLYVRER
ncbi:MAG: hypothetical protein N2317_04225 [Syntrophales bacterium]|nr:hypothetical protein [Syntrophales bacterium]